MSRTILYKNIFAAIFVLFAYFAALGQESPTSAEAQKGAVKISAQVEINGKPERLDRKRFYLIRGSREQNSALLKQIAETTVVSQDCYFADLRKKGKKISDQYICWLKKNDCESSYCREIKTPEEALAVPEFAAAYRQGLKEYRQQPVVALKWLNTNLPDEIRSGYYEKYKETLKNLINLAKLSAEEATRAKKGAAKKDEGFQSIMTDRIGNAFFLDVDVAPSKDKKTETYLISNLLPMVFGDTSFVWTCEVEVDPTKPQITFNLKTEIGKKKNCDIVAKPLTEACDITDCGEKAAPDAEKKTETN